MANRVMQAMIDKAVLDACTERTRPPRWTAEEDQFLRDQLGRISEAEIARKLGRTVNAIHLRWFRDLRLPAPSKAPGVLTAQAVARKMGLDVHTITWWVDYGFLPGRVMAGGRNIRLITQTDFEAWALIPENWVYFELKNIQDAKIKHLIEDAMKQWGDEWWGTPQVARHHNVTVKDVLRYIKARKIKARQIDYSRGGRHEHRKWRLWYILKSEATRESLHFVVYGPRKKATV